MLNIHQNVYLKCKAWNYKIPTYLKYIKYNPHEGQKSLKIDLELSQL